jgi:AcrR family transcriptional regulator
LAEAATVAGRADRRSSPKRGPATREDIDAAALELFARLGYHATSMRAIAAAAGVQPAAIYHWYPSKEALLVHLQDDFMDRLTEKLEVAMGAQERPALKLAAAVREHVVFHGLHPRAAFVTDSEIRALRPEARKRLIAQRDAYQDIFIEATDSGVRDGSLTASNPRVAMYSTLLACTGVALWFDPDGPLALDEVADLQVELVLSSLGAERELIEEAVA